MKQAKIKYLANILKLTVEKKIEIIIIVIQSAFQMRICKTVYAY